MRTAWWLLREGGALEREERGGGRSVKESEPAILRDCPFYDVELREVRGSGPLALMEREWCEHPKHSPCDRGRSAWHASPSSGWRNLTCDGLRAKCPLTPGQYEDVG
jgi:hypothetical protein